MDQNLKVDLTLLYYIQQERLNNEIVEKIIWNDSLNSQLDSLLFNDDEVQVLGLYGTLESVCEYLEERIGQKVEASQDIIKQSERGMIAFTKYQKDFFLMYLGPEQYFLKDKFEESAEITVYRYLKDLCQKIVLLPSKKILEQWKNLNNHYYQDQDSIVQEFEIKKVDEAQVDTEKLEITVKNEDVNDLQRLIDGQGNQRCVNNNILKLQYKQVDENQIKNYFLKIITHTHFDIQTLDLDQYKEQLQYQIRLRLKDYQQIINNIMNELYKVSYNKIKGWDYNFLKSNLKRNHQVFEVVHNVIFEFIRQSLSTVGINYVDKYKMEKEIINKLNELKLTSNEIVQQCSQDLQHIISEYLKQFNQLFEFRDRNSIPQLWRQLWQQIQADQQDFRVKQEFKLLYQLYEFKVINSLKDCQQFITIDQIFCQQLDIQELKIINPDKLLIKYYFTTSDLKNPQLLLLNTNQGSYEYIWVTIIDQQLQEVFKITQNSSQLKFFYNMQNTTLYVFNTKIGISIIQYNEDRKVIKSEKNIPNKLEITFIDICYLPFFETFILLTHKHQLYKWHIDTKEFVQINIQQPSPSQPTLQQCRKLLTSGYGNYFCMANQIRLDIVNFNNQVVKTLQFYECFQIQKLNTQNIQLFSDTQDWYLVYIDKQNSQAFQINNLSNLQKIVSKKKIITDFNFTNSYLDLVKGSLIKYGPSNNIFETTPYKTQLYIKNEIYTILESYIKLLDLQHSDDLIILEDVCDIIGHQIISKSLGFIILSRTSTQICTVEKQQLVPLSNGSLQKNYQNQIRILDKVNNLQFGILEKLLCMEDNRNIFIVSIMGRQSSGKSYLLNRIFGTRFGVSSARCTDGIWMSISKIENITFLILDCEGLFSTRRTQDEETMLLAFLSSISDITILNQDLTFSRNLNELFQNLSKSIEQIRGDKLFKGKLMIAVRDVNQKEKDSAQKELIKNIDIIKNNQLTGNFLTLLFNDQFQTILMSYFDNKQFDKDILQMRQEFLQNANNLQRWDNTQQLIRSMKIMLIQIEVKDHRSLEDHELEFIIKTLIRKTKDYWMQLNQVEIPELDLFDSSTAYKLLLNYSLDRLSIANDTLNFNNKLIQAEKLIQQVLKNRLDETLLYLQQDIQTKSINKINDEKIQKSIKEVRQNLQDCAGQYMICLQKCSQCFLFCTLRKDHLERDQLIHKDSLQDELIQIETKIIQAKLKLSTFEDLENIQEKIQSEKAKQIEVENLILVKQHVLDQEQKIKEIQDCLECQDYQTEIFQQLIQNHLKKSLQSINLEVLDDLFEDVGYIDNLQASNDVQIQQIVHQKQDENQKLISLEQKLIQIKNCNLIQERNQLTQKMEQLIKQTTVDHEVLENYKNQSINTQQQIQNFMEEYQNLVDKYLDCNIGEKIQQSKNQLQQQEGNLEKTKNQIQQKSQEISNQLRKQGIDNYLEIEIEKIEEIVQDIDSKIKFKQGKQSQRQQQKQEQQNKLEGNKVQEKEFDKINNKLVQIEIDIINFNKDIQTQENQGKFQNLILKKLQNLQQKFQDQEQIDDQVDQIDEISILIIKIFNSNLFSDKEFIELKILDISILMDELITVEKLHLLQSQAEQYQNKIKTLDLNLIENQKLLDNIHTQLNQINQNILENQEQEQICHQQLVLVQENLQIYDQQERKFNQIGLQLSKIKSSLILAQELNQQIVKLQNIITIQSTGIDQKILEQNTLSTLQIQASQINLELNDLMDHFQNMISFNELQNERLIKQRQLEDLESYLSKQHTCGRESHQCDQICQCCDNPLTMCQYSAGHSNEIESHLCTNNSHYCKQQCQVKNCDSFCQYQFNHSVELQHQCSGQHDCLELCQFCPKRCKQSSLNDHTIHQCDQVKCTKLCYFNYNYFNEDKKCINNCNKLHNEIHEHHVCSNQAHQCQIKCEQKGICQISTYTEIIKEWTTQNGSKFPYKIYKQNSEIMQCQQKVEKQQIIHDGVHYCNENHICDQRCPECSAFCTLKIGHEGKHQPHLHRNKEQQIFTALQGSDQEKLLILEAGLTKEYCIGESCEPETCLISCSRRSRAHYHLLECKGGKGCAEFLLNKFGIVAKHQTTKYKGSEKIYDEILCEAYWNYLGWEHPVESKQRNEISLCNYYCNSCKGSEQQFCIQEAWHTESSQYKDHIFTCLDKHKMNGLDVCFIIDTTSSMDPYIEMVKNLIAKLIKSTKKYHEKNKKVLRLAIISYKDHCDPQVIKSLDFTSYDTAIQFLINLKAFGGGDEPEAMLDGLQEATKLDWAEKSKRFVFLVADSPPHGKPKYHNFYDLYPKGCPCGLDESKVLNRLKDLNIELFILKLNSHLDQTIGIFKKIMPALNVLERVSKDEFINHIDKLICTELDIREITLTR